MCVCLWSRRRGFVARSLTYKCDSKVYRSNADDTFLAEVPERPGCTAYGDTQEVAFQNFNGAMALWIDTAREFGDPIPAPKGERLMLA